MDPDLKLKPATCALKRALLVALRCVDPDAEKKNLLWVKLSGCLKPNMSS